MDCGHVAGGRRRSCGGTLDDPLVKLAGRASASGLDPLPLGTTRDPAEAIYLQAVAVSASDEHEERNQRLAVYIANNVAAALFGKK